MSFEGDRSGACSLYESCLRLAREARSGQSAVAKQKADELKAKAEALKAQKRGLMQKLLTGQWRLKPSDMEAPAP